MQHRLSKSRFTAGSQCHRLLWWKAHEPDAVELQPDTVLQDRFDQGAHVGMLARERFPGGVLIDFPHDAVDQRVTRTRQLLADGAPFIYEASFFADETYVAVDVLAREPTGYRLIEVKSSSSQKDEHIIDAAVQVHVVQHSGVDVRAAEIMHLNKEFRHPSSPPVPLSVPSSPPVPLSVPSSPPVPLSVPERGDDAELFVRADVTAPVFALLHTIPGEIRAQLEMLRRPIPDAPIGMHCHEPRACPFMERCWPQSRDHIMNLYNVGPKRGCDYMTTGVDTIPDIPPTQRLPDAAKRQIRAMKENRLIVEPGLNKALAPFSGRLGFLDFETISRAVPVWPGMAPWEQAAAQFSYHEAHSGGTYTHAAFLAEGPEDARPKLARAMVEATAGAERVVTYTAFEKTRIRALQQCVPELATELEALERKLIDLHPVIRDHVYHPDFHGSFSLKHVLTPLVPELTYSDLVIVDGMVASVEIARLLFVAGKIPPQQHARVRQDLLDYCERDTWAMVKLLEKLRALA